MLLLHSNLNYSLQGSIYRKYVEFIWLNTYLKIDFRGARRGKGEDPPQKPKKIVVEKWSYFSEVYKMTKVLEDRRENG